MTSSEFMMLHGHYHYSVSDFAFHYPQRTQPSHSHSLPAPGSCRPTFFLSSFAYCGHFCVSGVLLQLSSFSWLLSLSLESPRLISVVGRTAPLQAAPRCCEPQWAVSLMMATVSSVPFCVFVIWFASCGPCSAR